MSTAERLARIVHPDPSPAFIRSIAADTELMAMAEADIDGAARTLIAYALDTVRGYVAAATDTDTRKTA